MKTKDLIVRFFSEMRELGYQPAALVMDQKVLDRLWLQVRLDEGYETKKIAIPDDLRMFRMKIGQDWLHFISQLVPDSGGETGKKECQDEKTH